jgi:HTH-type transcriptional regulator/antitoxin HigA
MIKSEKEYDEKLVRVELLMDAEPNTKEGDELEKLAKEVEAYETKHYPLPEPTKEDIEQFNREQRGMANES